MATADITTPVPPAATRGHGPVYRFLFHHEIDDYPSGRQRTGYLAIAVAATVVLYYTYFTQTGVTPNILTTYHMSFSFYVGIVVVSNLIGAFASLPASRTDRLGRSNLVIYGLVIVGLLIAVGVPNAHTEWAFAVIISAVGLVEGAILVATPALVRDFSPQLGRASAMGFWTVGPVAGSLVVSVVANHTLDHFGDWQSQFIISGLTAIGTFVLALFFLKDLSPRIRDQLMVSINDRTLVESRSRGITAEQLRAAIDRPWRQILKWDLVGSSLGIAMFLLFYYVAASFFTIYYAVTFKNPDGTPFSVTQANGLNTWFWAADIIALIVVGVLSDRLRVRKPFMLVGSLGAMAMLVVFLTRAGHPHTDYHTLALISAALAIFVAIAYAPWMAGYTETVEARNPALVGTGLALWGWILRLVVGISFIFLPVVINSVNPVVDNTPYATAQIQQFLAQHPKSVAFAQQHAALLSKIKANQAVVNAVSADPSPANVVAAVKALGPADFAQVVRYQTELKTLVEPYTEQLDYLAANQAHLKVLQDGLVRSPGQWQRWFWVDFAGMAIFVPLIFLTKGRWSPRQAKRDAEAHERAVAAELARLATKEAAGS
ncbi:MAG TPA: MFS transporter [Acidimicrobiales bacterium]|nr:MFS transporter [Acidimicrobiales bacterium]